MDDTVTKLRCSNISSFTQQVSGEQGRGGKLQILDQCDRKLNKNKWLNLHTEEYLVRGQNVWRNSKQTRRSVVSV